MEMWIAKNKGENVKCLFLYRSEPAFLKSLNGWVSRDEIADGITTGFLDESIFPEITFENSPKEIQITLKDKKSHSIELNKEEIEEILFCLSRVAHIANKEKELRTSLINKLQEIREK